MTGRADNDRLVSSAPQRILVVDDNPASRYATARVLTAAKFTVEEAGTGSEGLQKADGGLSAIVLDVHLPDVDGFEVCRRLRARADTSRVPVVYLSAAHVRDLDKVRGLESGADAYMTHPVEPDLLVATIRALVRARDAEERLRASEQRLQTIFDVVQSGICLLDEAGRVITANPALLSLLQRNRNDVEGADLLSVLPHSVRSEVQVVLERAFDEPQEAVISAGIGPNGRHVAVTATPLQDGNLRLVVANDVSERVVIGQQRELLFEREHAARVAFERLSRSKDEYIAILSHELRTPLNVITSWAHVLRGLVTTPEQEKGVDAIERNARTQARLIEDLLDMSRLDVGKLRLDLETVDAVTVVQSAVDSLGDTSRRKDITVSVKADTRPMTIRVDSARLQQMVWNLVSNAVKFSESGGQVDVAIEHVGDMLRLSIRDYGRGIDRTFLPYLFDRFSQSDVSSVRRHGGLGLGLSIVRRLAELHEGRAGAHSEGEGKGAIVWVELPVNGPSHQALDTAPVAVPDVGSDFALLAGRDVLLVEDDDDSAAMLRIVLENYAMSVRAVTSSAAALAEIERQRPDIIVSDIGLAGEDGYLLARSIRAQERAANQPRIPLVALTAFARAKDRQLALESGFDDHCSKPFVPHQLLATLQSRLAPVRTGSGEYAAIRNQR